ncbi:CD3072 family TudS-related putative desulfidase [Isachenkonia alkalipeptolytica]|uniref:DUF523 domain-containing protein n=1 Tax=Isachenkonia alkalipeptolytica TaxID=2565777 RepID=A0AA44BGT1_9CLOT|nr:CD3072 family TudS-related putative desulfidase [Isachenkonia alkalipeptolytica]NBG89576.1 hypothetical protein [Isachenkonia alkalipeptolytica]
MKRKKELLVTAHCILNQNAVIKGWERASGPFSRIVKIVLDQNLGIIQLPCPEFRFGGEGRPPMTLQQYDTPAYREHCRQLLEPVVEEINEYRNKSYTIKGIIGIERSPSCDSKGNPGIYMQVLEGLLEKSGITMNSWDVPVDYQETEGFRDLTELKAFLLNQEI